MKTFKDLNFYPHSSLGSGKQALMDFGNGYGVSVVTGNIGFHINDLEPYEVAILKGTELCYNTPISNSVIGYCTEERVTEIMQQVQNLK